MLDYVAHARKFGGIAEVSHVDVHSRAGLICVCILDKQDLKLIFQLDNSVLPIIESRSFELVCDGLNRAMPLFSKGTVGCNWSLGLRECRHFVVGGSAGWM